MSSGQAARRGPDLDDREAYEDGPLVSGHEGFSSAAGLTPANLEREFWC